MQKTFELVKSKQDEQACGRIVEHFRGQLAGFVHNRLSHKLREVIDVDDVVQETFARAFQRLDQINWQGEKAFASWLCGIALNVVRESSRRYLRIDVQKHEEDLAGSSATPSQHQRRDERFDRLKSALRGLSKDHCTVITLSRIQGLPAAEVAARMNRSVEATYQLLWRAIKHLKEGFGDTESLRLPPRSIELEDEHGQQ